MGNKTPPNGAMEQQLIIRVTQNAIQTEVPKEREITHNNREIC